MAKLDLFGLVVKDMAASLNFYRLLGMAIPAEMDHEGHVEVTLPGGLRLAWDSLEVILSFNDEWQTPVGHRMGIAFLCDSPGDVDRLYDEVVAAGYEGHKPPWDAFWGQRYAQVKDPDGNLVDLFAPLA
ncbi:MAG: VOC family protein [Anaerolineaceae bacterium]|nr:VOC family protein [Anaerolineaceae bacterium]